MKTAEPVYYKRFRMEYDLRRPIPRPELPPEFTWEPWRPALLSDHAAVMHSSFAAETDAQIFPNFTYHEGCERLIREIVTFRGFLPSATWLVRYGGLNVGTVQGVADSFRLGTVQNLGVIPAARRRGVASALLLRALHGFRDAGLRRAALEVTAENLIAVRMYRRLGFRRKATLFRAVIERQSS